MTKEIISKIKNQLLYAMVEHDVNALDGLLHDDLLFITPDGQVAGSCTAL